MKNIEKLKNLKKEVEELTGFTVDVFRADELYTVDKFLAVYYVSEEDRGILTPLQNLFLGKFRDDWAKEEDMPFLIICYEDILRRLKTNKINEEVTADT